MSPSRIFDFLFNQLEQSPKDDCLNCKVNGEWVHYSTLEVVDICNDLSCGLLAAGIEAGCKVAIVSENRPEWNFVDLAAQQIGAISVPLYPTITVEDYAYIIDHAEVDIIFASTRDLHDKVTEALAGKELKGGIYTFDQLDGLKHWTEVRKLGQDNAVDLATHREKVSKEDIATYIYTSGTTGRPKGVMLTHNNLVSNSLGTAERITGNKPILRAISFLPLSHVYERTGIYYYIYRNISIYYAENLESIAANMQEIKPHTFNTVPRLLEKIYDKIVAKGEELTGTKRKLFFWALDLGLRYEPNKSQGLWYNIQLGIARKLIFSKWQDALGGELVLLSSGGAALQPRLGRVFWAAGIKVCEGYGLTETSPVMTASYATEKDIRIGKVGRPIRDVEVKIAEDGEVLCKGPNVMKGYYKAPEQTAEVLKDGWFHTGDIGEIDDEGYLRITDRKKEMFKTSGGKYVAPQLIENKLKESSFVEQAIVIGSSRKFPSALLVPNYDSLRKACSDAGITYTDDAAMCENEYVKGLFDKAVEQANATFAKWEKVKKYALVQVPFSIEGGELTAKLSMKRRVINEKYNDLIESIYAD